MMPPVVILAGGLATRLYPVTKTIPKSMIDISEKPFIASQLELLKEKGITDVVICSGYLGEQIEEFVKDGKDFGISVKYSYDGDKLLGTGGALKKALPLLGDMFFVMYGDSYLDMDYSSVFNFFMLYNKKGLMTVIKNEDQWDKSNVVYSDGQIVRYDKKHKTEDMKYIDYGLGVLRKEAFEQFKEGEIFDLADLYHMLIENKEMLGYEIMKRFYEIGSPSGIKETSDYIKKRRLY